MKNSIGSLEWTWKKTKVMVSALNQGSSFQSRKHSCGVCFKLFGVSFILCTLCNHRIYYRCVGLKNKLAYAINFECKAFLNLQISLVDCKAVELDGSYLGGMINAGDGTEANTVARVRSSCKRFRVLLLLLVSRVISLKQET